MLAPTIGAVRLRDAGWQPLFSPVATLVHAASVLPDTLEHVVDALHAAPTVNLTGVLAPEHGFRGTQQAEHGDPDEHIDAATNLTVFSVYRRNTSALVSIFENLQTATVLVDLVDVGTRLYTFIWTLYDLMAAAATMGEHQPAFVITDRPNPLGGEVVEGPLLNVSCCASRYGRLPVPHRHGLTVGEMALLMQASLGATAPPVRIIPMLGWKRRASADELDRDALPWLPPSPNLPTVASVLAYPVSVWLEATPEYSEGRGSSLPFSLLGAPGLDGAALAAKLNGLSRRAAGRCEHGWRTPAAACVHPSAWRSDEFVPMWWKFNGTDCGGVQLVRPPRQRLFGAAVELLVALRDASPSGQIAWDGSWFGTPGPQLVDEYAGTPRLRELLAAGEAAKDIQQAFEEEAQAFERTRRRFLLYD